MAYEIHGMSCNSCVQKVKTALAENGIQADVTLKPPRLIVQQTHTVSLAKLNEVIGSAGHYHVTEIAEEAMQIGMQDTSKSWCAWFKTYYPLLLIVTMISVVSLRGADTVHDWMLHFMAGFFLVFGFFKLLDIRGFRDAYSSYDLLAKKWYAYGFIYPFLELALGFAFLFRFELHTALWASIILMGFGGIGVVQALSKKQTIRCACLGTVLNLPMSTVTIIENFGMVLMSALMLANII